MKSSLTQVRAAKRIAIVGLGREGDASYRFLEREGYLEDTTLYLADERPLEQLDAAWQLRSQKQDHNFKQTSTLGENGLTIDVVLQTPGIHPRRIHAEFGIHYEHLTTNTQLFFDWMASLEYHEQLTTIAITGTKGKSTTAALCDHLLKCIGNDTVHTTENKLMHHLGGNIGKPPLDLCEDIARAYHASPASKQYITLELSSHQLMDRDIAPDIAIFHGIYPEHMDYYRSMDEYAEAKSYICRNQSAQQWLIFDTANEITTAVVKRHCTTPQAIGLHTATTAPSTSPAQMNAIISLQNQELQAPMLAPGTTDSLEAIGLDIQKIQLRGDHNYYNLSSVVLAISILFDLDDMLQHTIHEAIASFTPLAHRLQPVHQIANITFINDSLATTPESVINAIESFPDTPIALIAGGYDRGQDYSSLVDSIAEHAVISVATLPTTGSQLHDLLKKQHASKTQTPAIESFQSLEKAVQWSWKRIHATVSDSDTEAVVLLSPGAASFNMFADYKARGAVFREAALSLVTDS